jgi:hypothetical protein
MASGFQLYVTFSGEAAKAPSGTTNTPVKHVLAYDASGTMLGSVTPDYDELRGMALDASGRLYLAIAQQKSSAVVVFSVVGSDGYSRTLLGSAVTPQSSSALDHPYELAFDGANVFVSSQDTNVVSGYAVPSAGYPAATLDVASYLSTTFRSGGTFYPGTWVASAQPVTIGSETPPAVPVAQGGLTMTGFDAAAASADAAKPPAKHSVRGMLFADGVLYVADEGGARVALYDAASGTYSSSLTATTDGTYTFQTPVGLALDAAGGHVYIGDPGNDAIFSYHPHSRKLEVVVDKKSGGHAVEKVSGLAVAPDGTLFFASRKAQAISTVDSQGNVTPFVTGLSDTPECVLIVPM